jgi:hypothetical protein
MQRRSLISISSLLVVLGISSIAEAKNAIEIENEKPVDPVTDSWLPELDPVTWEATKIGIDGTVDVYPSAWSVQNGEKLGIRISTTASKTRLRIYRIGWYPNSPAGPVGSRLVHEVPSLPGVNQPFPAEDVKTGIVEAKWSDSYVLTIPADWVTGHYAIRVTTDSGKDAYSFFVLRDDAQSIKSPILYVDTMATAQAYNPWPKYVDASGKQTRGRSTYDYNSAGPTVLQSGSSRAVQVSLDRPFGENWGLGIWRDWTVPTVQWLEMMGYDVAYASSLDLDAGFVLYGRKMYMDSGHDEYWSRSMWDNLAWARDEGLNLAFLSANDFTWQVRFEPGSGGPKSTMTVYKTAAYPNTVICGDCTGDPEWVLAYEAKKKGDTATQIAHLKNVTYGWSSLTDWDPVAKKYVAPPANVARSAMDLEGLVNGPKVPACGASPKPDDACMGLPWVVSKADHWIYTGAGVTGGVATHVKNGDHIPQIVGYEMDTARLDKVFSTRPKTQVVLASTDKYGWANQFNAQYYEHASGAKVFSTGTINWPWGFDRPGMGNWGGVDLEASVGSAKVKDVVSGITVNVLNKLTEGPVRIPIPPGGIPGAPPPPKTEPPPADPDADPPPPADPDTDAGIVPDGGIVETDAGEGIPDQPAANPEPEGAVSGSAGCGFGASTSGSPLSLLLLGLLARRRR